MNGQVIIDIGKKQSPRKVHDKDDMNYFKPSIFDIHEYKSFGNANAYVA